MIQNQTAYGPNLLTRLLSACSLHQIDECAKSAWILHGEGLLQDGEMDFIAPVIEHQRKFVRPRDTVANRAPHVPSRPSRFPPHRRSGIPDDKRAASWLRRRSLAKSCPIPNNIAREFTVSKLAVLTVIARAVLQFGKSNMSLPEIAARAGVGCTIARYALRQAAQMGLIVIVENRRHGKRNLPNTIRVVASAWRKWLDTLKKYQQRNLEGDKAPAHRPATPLRNLRPTDDNYINGKRDKPAYSDLFGVNGPPAEGH